MNDTERLIIEQAIYSRVADDVSTKNPDNLRGRVDARYKELYDETGAKSFECKLCGQSVATYSIRVSKPKPQQTRTEFCVNDYRAAHEFAVDGISWEVAADYLHANIEDYLEWYARETGEVPDGCEWEEVVIPEVEPSYLGGTLKVDASKVAEVIAVNNLDGGIAGLLEG